MPATMFPKKPRSGTTSNAEILLFHELERQLPAKYHIHHSVAWQFRDPTTGVKDRENDFVIIDPLKGILVLEVKGGKHLSYDGQDTGLWFRGSEVMEDDPFRQGVRVKKHILQKLKELFGNFYYYYIGNAAAFPEVEINLINPRPDINKKMILDIHSIGNLSKWVGDFFDYLIADPQKPYFKYSDEDLEKLDNALAPSFKFTQPITMYFANLNRLVSQMTAEQYEVIKRLHRQKQLAIPGCAGSGKTLLAIEKANTLARENDKKVLLLCHNPYLAEYMRNMVFGDVFVYDFTAFVKDIAGEQVQRTSNLSRINKINSSRPWTHYERPSDLELEEAFRKQIVKPVYFDAVIVDEGQDFEENWWKLVEACLEDFNSGIFYIFFDDFQATFPVGSRLKYQKIPQSQIVLDKNCRNSGKVFTLIQSLYPEETQISDLLKDEGEIKEWQYVSNEDVYFKLDKALKKAERYSLDLRSIVILTSENGGIIQSRINGWVFNSQNLQKSNEKGRGDWQEAVIHYLGPFGINQARLSNEVLPSQKDISLIADVCQVDWLSTKIPWLLENIPFRWNFNQYGELRLKSADKSLSVKNKEQLFAFFGNPKWVDTLPQNQKRYRLTPKEDFEKYPYYENVLLVDIPSFKGLEADGIIFVNYGYLKLNEIQEKLSLYVGLSRARHLLYMISPFSIVQKYSY